MSIPAFVEKIKTWAGERRTTLIFIGILTLVAISSFYLGYIARLETSDSTPEALKPFENSLSVSEGDQVAGAGNTPTLSDLTTPLGASSGSFIASKNGTKYYPVACASAKRIKDANKVFFTTAKDAEKEGYTLASGC